MSLIVFTVSYGSPGDVEHAYISKPATLTEWTEQAKEARENKGGFLECTTNPRNTSTGSTTSKKCVVNLEQVEWVFEGE